MSMNTISYSFRDIFDTTFSNLEKESIQLKKIVIPIIQRDYAQGRLDSDVSRVRTRFLNSLYEAVTERPITLDFVYGDIDQEGTMTPLDGQQRLTTLFLLYWYAAKKDNKAETEWKFLRNFSYETRYSARNFCKQLVDFTPSFKGLLSKEIVNQYWFPLGWKRDPTISSMLVMLDDIQKRFSEVKGLWERLSGGAITFYFLPIKDMGLTGELYIKMNSRGKPLTRFENFKAELEREVRLLDENIAGRIVTKFDVKWTDLLWSYRSIDADLRNNDTVDDMFLRYFKFICDVICYKRGESPLGRSSDELELIERYFSHKNAEDTRKNINMLEGYFDCWCDIEGYETPKDFLQSFISNKHESGKIVVDAAQIDIFGDCLCSYSEYIFPLSRVVLLYAIILYLQKRNEITEDDFVRRIRIINNLINNSEDEITVRVDRNRIPAILGQVDSIIQAGQINDEIENNFNAHQLIEEQEKLAYLDNFTSDRAKVFRLEDHPKLYGQISILGLENIDCCERFYSLFDCDWDKIDCAMMSIGDYGQQERNGWRYQYASSRLSSAWEELFHRSANSGFEKIKEVLVKLLRKSESFSDDKLQEIIDKFIAECEDNLLFPWRYYYVKYSDFRPGRYGKMSNNNKEKEPYLFSVMQTQSMRSQASTYMPYLKEANKTCPSKENVGQSLWYTKVHVVCANSAFLVRSNEDEKILERIEIAQNSDGVDVEDRILKLIHYIISSELFP